MIKVVKHGSTMRKTTCPNCHCEFLYQQGDVQLMERRINAYTSETEYVYVKCPECKTQIRL